MLVYILGLVAFALADSPQQHTECVYVDSVVVGFLDHLRCHVYWRSNQGVTSHSLRLAQAKVSQFSLVCLIELKEERQKRTLLYLNAARETG